MNTKLLASFAVFVLLAAVIGTSLTSSAFAASDAFMKIDGVKGESKDTKKAAMKEKKDAKKAEIKEKKDTKKAAMKEKKDTKKAEIKEKKDAKKAEIKEKKDTKKTSATASAGTAVSEVTVDMAKGTASDTNCGEQCYMPSTVTVTVGGKVTWKNVDSAAHTATATDSSFDTSLVNAGASASNTFNTAGSYPYMCILHPWMKGTVNVQ